MTSGRFRFGDFELDAADRLLRRHGARVELSARYLDALALMVGEAGKLVTKDRFMDEVWRGVPVTDEALTQCVRTLRRVLGDEAARPLFIETVPKHGYRFIAPVEAVEREAGAPVSMAASASAVSWRHALLIGAAGAIGGALAGIVGGLFYGFIGAGPGMGAASVLVVLLCINIMLGLIGGAGVGFGIGAARALSGRFGPWCVAGGAGGGIVVGAVVKLLGLDAFELLLGQSPGDMTGAGEGALLGGAVGLGVWLGARVSPRRGAAVAALVGGVAGIAIALLGGRLMGGSLDLLARIFPDSRLRADNIGALFGETGFGPISQAATGALEGLVFAGMVGGALLLARRSLDRT
jgi:DNA-binding winged helix-turn-helix (wHTH) protein